MLETMSNVTTALKLSKLQLIRMVRDAANVTNKSLISLYQTPIVMFADEKQSNANIENDCKEDDNSNNGISWIILNNNNW